MPTRARSTKKPAAKAAKKQSSEGASRAHSMWTGSISFGLVQVPVKMRHAERMKELSFHQLDKHDNARIRYDRVNEKTGKKVAWGDIVKGYEIARGEYVIVEDDDLVKASPEATHTIDIQSFVKRSDIPVEYFERPYYLVPEKNGARAYSVLRTALEGKDLIAIALVVIRTKQHLCAIMPEGDALMLMLMRFESEIVPVASVKDELPHAVKASPQELKLAEQLVATLTAEWDPSQYVDTYTRELKKALERKAKTGTIAAPKTAGEKEGSGKILDLLSQLQESVARGAPGPHKAHKKSAKEDAA